MLKLLSMKHIHNNMEVNLIIYAASQHMSTKSTNPATIAGRSCTISCRLLIIFTCFYSMTNYKTQCKNISTINRDMSSIKKLTINDLHR